MDFPCVISFWVPPTQRPLATNPLLHPPRNQISAIEYHALGLARALAAFFSRPTKLRNGILPASDIAQHHTSQESGAGEQSCNRVHRKSSTIPNACVTTILVGFWATETPPGGKRSPLRLLTTCVCQSEGPLGGQEQEIGQNYSWL